MVPLGQIKQWAAPGAGLYVPGSQGTSRPDPTGQLCPAGQR